MKHYELTCLMAPELPEQELNSLQEKVVSFIQEQGGILLETSKKRSRALLLVFNAQLEPGNLANLEKKLKSEKEILRFIILAKPRTFSSQIPSYRARRGEEKVRGKVEISKIEKKLEEILKE